MDFLGNDSDPEVDFTINQDYAKRYEKWRRGEEIQKIKDKYGDVEDTESSTSEEEDEDGKELTKDVEKQFFKTLSCLKERNPKIYDQNVRFFEAANSNGNLITKKENEQTLTLAGYQRKVLIETGGQFSDDEKDEKAEQSFEMMNSKDQEYDIKKSFRDVLKDSDSENGDEENWGNLFTKRVKTAEELEKEEDDFKQWLAGENEKLKNTEIEEELKGLHDYWTDPKLDEGEKFLRDYILNKRYLESNDKHKIPSYDEIVHDSDLDLSADEDTLNKQDEFEKKYNFRFEEPDSEFIKRYPRTMEQSMRKKDERRKKHREEVKQRKLCERSKKDEELKRLKTLKKKEIMEKIKKLQHVTGNEDIAFQAEDLQGDFDPQKHDERMAEIFNENYYGIGEDEEKPEFPDIDEELEIENWDDWNGFNEQEEELHCEDPGFNMDCDYEPGKKELQNELIENSRRRKKRKRSKFAEAVARPKPVFDPTDKTFEQYVDEYYALDYEDLIGDIPCRFKYRKVVPNDFGLSIEEILNATDQELNRWVSIKKIVRRLPEHVELYDVKAYKRKAANINKKRKFFPSLFESKADDMEQPLINENLPKTVEEDKQRSKKNKNKSNNNQISVEERVDLGQNGFPLETKEIMKNKNNHIAPNVDTGNDVVEPSVQEIHSSNIEEEKRKSKKKKKKKGKNNATAFQDIQIQDASEVSQKQPDSKPSGKKKKKKKQNKQNSLNSQGLDTSVASSKNMDSCSDKIDFIGTVEKLKKKKKKKKKKVENVVCMKTVNVNQGSKKDKISKSEVQADKLASVDNKEKKKKKKKHKGAFVQELQNTGKQTISAGKIPSDNSKHHLGKRKRNSVSEKNSSPEHEQKCNKKKKFNNSNNNPKENNVCSLSDARLKSYGLNPKKFKNKLKYNNLKI